MKSLAKSEMIYIKESDCGDFSNVQFVTLLTDAPLDMKVDGNEFQEFRQKVLI